LRLIFIARFNVDYYIIKGLKCQHLFLYFFRFFKFISRKICLKMK